MVYESAFGPPPGTRDSMLDSRSSFRSPFYDHSQGGFRRDAYGQSQYGYEQPQQSSAPKPKTVIKLSIQPKTGRVFASLRGSSHVYSGNSIDDLAKAMASIGGRGFLDIGSVGFDYQGNPVLIDADRIDGFGGWQGENLSGLDIVPGLSRVKCGNGGRRYIRGTEPASRFDADDLSARITQYRFKALQEHAEKAERTRIATEENNRLSAERNAGIQRNRPQIHGQREPVRRHGYTSFQGSGSDDSLRSSSWRDNSFL